MRPVDWSNFPHAASETLSPVRDPVHLSPAVSICDGMVLKSTPTFVAIDFEIASRRPDSACAVGLAACSHGRVVLARSYLIRPPSKRFTFTGLHGLSWEQVCEAPSFAELWPTLRPWLERASL